MAAISIPSPILSRFVPIEAVVSLTYCFVCSMTWENIEMTRTIQTLDGEINDWEDAGFIYLVHLWSMDVNLDGCCRC